jgi:lysozyme
MSTNSNMHTSPKGLDLIIHFEGFSETPYLCSAGVPTIGYGSTVYPNGEWVTMDDAPVNKHEARGMLLHHMNLEVEHYIKSSVMPNLLQREFDALASFIYNLGGGNFMSSTMLDKLNSWDKKGAADEFPKWRMAGGKVSNGLVRRRKSERHLFLTGELKFFME